MSVLIEEKDLPLQLELPQAVEAAYTTELVEAASKLQRGLPVLIECDKDLAPHLFVNLRGRLKAGGLQCLYLDGRPRGDEPAQPGGMQLGLIGTMIAQLREAVRGAIERRVVVLPHLDLLTTSQGGLTNEAREVIPLLYENPELVWLGFKDPSFPLPRVIENLFPHRISLLGIARPRLRHLVTQRDSRKFGKKFNPWALYKFVSGVNAVRLRKLLTTLEGEDYPADPRNAYKQVRQATLGGTLEVPNIDLEKDIGGYAKVKERLRKEILDVLAFKDRMLEADEVARLEELIPRGMIFWGPPGTGKTLFAKAMATALGAALTVVSGPELKSKWVGESEENLRQIFHRARQSAPAIIVFDELDSFASARGTYTGSGVEHSMVNQLLTEMDGFHRDELVFVVGTTNFVEILDPALLRPGRFEFHLHIPYPEDEDRKAILKIYDEKMRLQMSDEALEYAVRRTSDRYVTQTGTPFSGDHLNALCRAVARIRVRENRRDATTPDDIERGLTEFDERMEWTEKEALRMATHEAGHFLCSLACPHHPPPERITIRSEMPWAPAYVGFQKDETFRIGRTRNQMLDDLCVLMGGIEAERLLLHDISTGAGGGQHSDLFRASQVAHAMVEVFGMGTGPSTGLRVFRDAKGDREVLSGIQAEAIDRQINTLLAEAQGRAAAILKEHQAELVRVRDEVMEKKVLEGERVREIVDTFKKSEQSTETNGEQSAGRQPKAESR
jgi:cell division protease FtsH